MKQAFVKNRCLAAIMILLALSACKKDCAADMRGTYKLDDKETYLVIDQKNSMLFCKPRNVCVRVKYSTWEEMFTFQDIMFSEYAYDDKDYADLVYFKGSKMVRPCVGILPFRTGIDVGVDVTAILRPID